MIYGRIAQYSFGIRRKHGVDLRGFSTQRVRRATGPGGNGAGA